MADDFFQDVKDTGIPSKKPYSQVLLQKYLEGELQSPIMATTRRPAYRAIVSPTRGDGADYDNIQKAIDTVHELGGGTVFIKSGTYYISSTILLYDNVTLQGEDPYLSILDFQGNTVAYPTNQIYISVKGTSGDHITNVIIRDLTITHCAYEELGIISFEYADWCKVQNVRMVDCNDSNDNFAVIVYGTSSTFIQISDCAFISCDRGIFFDGVDNAMINRNLFSSMPRDVMNIIRSDYCTFRDNKVDSCGGSTSWDFVLYIGPNNPYFLIDNNFFYNSHAANTIWGEDISGSYNGRIINNVLIGDGGYPFSSGAYQGIQIDTVISPGLTISGNKIQGYKTSGIDLANCHYASIQQNFLQDIGVNFILLQTCTNGIISGNNFLDPIGTNAIKLTSNSNSNTICGNNVAGDFTNGIYVASGDKNIINGNILGVATDAVRLDSGSDYNIITSNQFYGIGYVNSGTGNGFANNIDV